MREYSATPSIPRYVLLEQDDIQATVYVRDGDRTVVEAVTRGGVLTLPDLGIDIPIDDLYRNVIPDAAL